MIYHQVWATTDPLNLIGFLTSTPKPVPILQLWPMSELGPSLSPAAERMRLHRERRRQGWRCFVIALHVTEIEALVAMGLLENEIRDNSQAVSEALGAHLDRTLGARS